MCGGLSSAHPEEQNVFYPHSWVRKQREMQFLCISVCSRGDLDLLNLQERQLQGDLTAGQHLAEAMKKPKPGTSQTHKAGGWETITESKNCLGCKKPLGSLSLTINIALTRSLLTMSPSATLFICLLNTSRAGDSTAFPGSPFQWLTTLLMKNIYLIFNLDFSWCNLRLFPFILVTWEKKQPPLRW